MNFSDIMKLGSQSAPIKRKQTAEVWGDLSSNFLGGKPTKNWLDLYNENPRLAVVHKISQDNGATPFKIKGKTAKGEYYITNHPLENEINKHSVPQFFSLWTAYRLMQGTAYIAFDLQGGIPVNLKVFSKAQLSKSAKDGDSYSFRLGSETVTYPKKQVIVDLDLDLNNPYTNGRGKAEAVKDEIETDELVQQYIKNFYYSSARPDIYVTAEPGESMDEDDIKRLEASWLNKFQGVENAHKPVFLSWAAKIFSVPTNHRDMELLDTRKFYRDTTIQHFGVPPEIMGIVENSNKATVIAAEHIYAKQVRMPILHLQELLINTYLLPLYPNSERMTFEFDNIVPDDVELTLSVLKEAREASSITVNEWRTRMGFPLIKSDYGNMVLGSVIPAEAVQVDDSELSSRGYKVSKDYSEFVTDDFVQRASKKLGMALTNDTIILTEEET